MGDGKETNVSLRSKANALAKRITSSTLARVGKYTFARAIMLAISVVIGVFLAILVTNYGGYIDDIFREGVDWGIIQLSRNMQHVPVEERFKLLEQARWEMEDVAGLHKPFLVRCFSWLGYGLTLNWGAAGRTRAGMWVVGTAEDILPLILERVPYTLLLAGSANLVLFFTTVSLALILSKKHGSWLDRLLLTLSPISSVPSWIHGILLTVIFAAGLQILPFGGMFGNQPPETKLGYIPVVLKHMMLPIAAIFLSTFFHSVYAWRSFFLLYTMEDYVEMARAKGLPPRMLEQRHILRPALPNLITSFALMLISFWQGVVILEVFFDWPGIGKFFIDSIQGLNRPVVVGLVVTFAYLLAITVFVLDIVYVLVDPRVRVGGADRTVRAASRKRDWRFRLRLRWPQRPSMAQTRGWKPLPGSTPSASGRAGAGPSGPKALWRRWIVLKPTLREISRFPSAMVGLAIIAILIGVSIYAAVAMPYDETIGRWRGEGDVWYQNPKKALPEWLNLFRKVKLPRTIILDSRDSTGAASKHTTLAAKGMTEITLSLPFDFPYGAFPQDLVIYFEAQYDEKLPLVSLTWLTPDGREIEMGSFSIVSSQAYYLSQDLKLQRRLDGQLPIQALFADPAAEMPVPLTGAYELRVSAFAFEEDADLDAEFVLHGQVFGLAGTDHRRRDLSVALLWGLPLALAFGLLGAVGTATSTMVIAAVGTWLGGRVDGLIQHATEVNMILPTIPICITIYIASSKSIWAILGVMVLLSIFGSAIKNYRAIFLQVKEEPYIEAARAYGAGDWRIISRYLIPRIIPVLVPQLVILIPSYVFLEAMLAYLGVSDPTLPTWGKLIEAGISHGLYTGASHMVLEPLALLLLVGLAFVLLGRALEHIFQSRLREA
jgi:peptide/nickel transport system permease protein